MSKIDDYSQLTNSMMNELADMGISGDGHKVDHIEIFGPSDIADSKNFVLCPGGAYDRSPCGTGTSAKLACLFDDQKLDRGEIYRQESITGSVFEGWVEIIDGQIIPTIRGQAWVTGESILLFADDDPLKWGYQP
jgi:4-hydroxyproline epimerase